MKRLLLVVSLVALGSLTGCCCGNRPLFGGNPYANTYSQQYYAQQVQPAPQYYAQPVPQNFAQPAPQPIAQPMVAQPMQPMAYPVQTVQYLQPQICPQPCQQVCPQNCPQGCPQGCQQVCQPCN